MVSCLESPCLLVGYIILYQLKSLHISMKTFLLKSAFYAITVTFGFSSCKNGTEGTMSFEHYGDTLTIVHIKNPARYLLLPIEETADEAKVRLDTGNPADTDMDVRLALGKTEYFVPFALPVGTDEATVRIAHMPRSALCWKDMQLSDTFDVENREKYRPLYHHTPVYGWMNDANGLVYKDGEYHLYYQYNPYGSVWGNMHWGHSVSRDLLHWEHLDAAIARDTLGHIFSGSCIVDRSNSAGTGKDNIVAFYTSHKNVPDGQRQVQCMAWSTDNGRTFTKYEGNPILTPFDGLQNFRDPKVFWYEPEQKWIMIVSADKNMRFYTSHDLKQWEYMSEWGAGHGPQPNQFECPDFLQMPVDGDKSKMKWVMIVNINPGFVHGGSGTMYFVGDFDGHKFTCDTKPDVVKWLDWGKDHYATVCFSNTGDRIIAMPWMSNWQYANLVPTRQFRSANSLPRELTLHTGSDGGLYVNVSPVSETMGLRKESKDLGGFSLTTEKHFNGVLSDNQGAFELDVELAANGDRRCGVELYNAKEEKVVVYLDAKGRVVMDRSESGIVDFGNLVQPHQIETESSRRACISGALHYKNDFALATWAPIDAKSSHKLQIFVDKSSLELFVDGGRVAMTNLVFPDEPYNSLRFFSEDGKAEVKTATVYRLGL